MVELNIPKSATRPHFVTIDYHFDDDTNVVDVYCPKCDIGVRLTWKQFSSLWGDPSRWAISKAYQKLSGWVHDNNGLANFKGQPLTWGIKIKEAK